MPNKLDLGPMTTLLMQQADEISQSRTALPATSNEPDIPVLEVISMALGMLGVHPSSRHHELAQCGLVVKALNDTGYAIVPKEPTGEMLKAGCVALDKTVSREELMAAELSGQPHALGRAKMKLRWVAMLAAADKR